MPIIRNPNLPQINAGQALYGELPIQGLPSGDALGNIFVWLHAEQEWRKASIVGDTGVTVTPDPATGDLLISVTSAGGSALTIQEEDGTPTGTFTTLKVSNGTLVDNGDGSASLTIAGTSAGGEGTAFPTAPALNQRFYRTDRHIEYYYDGNRWLSTTLYRQPFGPGSVLPPAINAAQLGRFVPGATDLWLTKFITSTHVSATNNASNYWTIQLSKYAAPNTATEIITLATSAHAASTWVQLETIIDEMLGTTNIHLQINAAKVGSPGGLYFAVELEYRLIG